MGLLNAMKGANNSWGYATGSCIEGVGYFGPENMVDNRNHKLMVSGSGMKESIVFGKEDVTRMETLFATGDWVKYRIMLKDGKEIIVTVRAMENNQQGGQISMNLLNLESWLSDVIYK
ncbi:MAG: hypothetical protein ACI3XF_05555 [Eubacteriales bacterium]